MTENWKVPIGLISMEVWTSGQWPVLYISCTHPLVYWIISAVFAMLVSWTALLQKYEGRSTFQCMLSSRQHVTRIPSKGRLLMTGPSYKHVSSLQLRHFLGKRCSTNRKMMASPQAGTHSFEQNVTRIHPFLRMWKWGESWKYLLHLKLFQLLRDGPGFTCTVYNTTPWDNHWAFPLILQELLLA